MPVIVAKASSRGDQPAARTAADSRHDAISRLDAGATQAAAGCRQRRAGLDGRGQAAGCQ